MTLYATLSRSQRKKLRRFQEKLPDIDIDRFRETFESELERELIKAQEQVMDVVKSVVLDSVTRDIGRSIGDTKLETRLYLDDPQVKIEEEGGTVRFYVTVEGYVGGNGREGATNRDIGKLKRMFVDPKSMSLDSIDGQSIGRPGDIEVRPLQQPAQLLTGRKLDSNHSFQATYVAEIPKAMFPTIYNKHNPQA